MDSGNAASEPMRDIENRGIGVGKLTGDAAPRGRTGITVEALEHINGAPRPDGPLPQEAAHHPQILKRSNQVEHDVIVIPQVSRAGAPGLANTASSAAKRRQNSTFSRRPPAAGCK